MVVIWVKRFLRRHVLEECWWTSLGQKWLWWSQCGRGLPCGRRSRKSPMDNIYTLIHTGVLHVIIDQWSVIMISDRWSVISWSALPPYKTDQVWMETMITWRKSFCGTLSLRTGLYCENVIFLNRRISKHFQMKKSNPNSGRSLERWWRGDGALRWPRWSTIPNQTKHNQILALPNQTDLSHSKP